jgi:hypothetical protein
MVGTINPHIGLSPTSNHPCWAHRKKPFGESAKGLEIVKLPGQNDFRTFCMIDETEKVYQKLVAIITI